MLTITLTTKQLASLRMGAYADEAPIGESPKNRPEHMNEVIEFLRELHSFIDSWKNRVVFQYQHGAHSFVLRAEESVIKELAHLAYLRAGVHPQSPAVQGAKRAFDAALNPN